MVEAGRVEPLPPDPLERVLRLVISGGHRDPLRPLATVNDQPGRVRLRPARSPPRGADDALLLSTDARLAEATSVRVLLVAGAALVRPSRGGGILVSTTREGVISSGAPMLGVVVREDRLVPGELFTADEAFLASSVAGMLPVPSVDGRLVGAGGRRDLATGGPACGGGGLR